jgi:hypothetical protein
LIKWNDVWRLNRNEETIKKGDGEMWTKVDRARHGWSQVTILILKDIKHLGFSVFW